MTLRFFAGREGKLKKAQGIHSIGNRQMIEVGGGGEGEEEVRMGAGGVEVGEVPLCSLEAAWMVPHLLM